MARLSAANKSSPPETPKSTRSNRLTKIFNIPRLASLGNLNIPTSASRASSGKNTPCPRMGAGSLKPGFDKDGEDGGSGSLRMASGFSAVTTLASASNSPGGMEGCKYEGERESMRWLDIGMSSSGVLNAGAGPELKVQATEQELANKDVNTEHQDDTSTGITAVYHSEYPILNFGNCGNEESSLHKNTILDTAFPKPPATTSSRRAVSIPITPTGTITLGAPSQLGSPTGMQMQRLPTIEGLREYVFKKVTQAMERHVEGFHGGDGGRGEKDKPATVWTVALTTPHPQTIAIGPYTIVKPDFVVSVTIVLYSTLLFITALDGPKCLLLMLWRFAVVLAGYAAVAHKFGWDEVEGGDFLLEPAGYLVAVLGQMAVVGAGRVGGWLGSVAKAGVDGFGEGYDGESERERKKKTEERV
ncbi:uncharacterized protein BDR25DRAFT_385093 [Lindgomyces ingoldianus]|uniref:Uncharacterized protein n=1 Tax=Lindgomyces ingoldianus TaxID=673940 RepID=A0ACB6Q837_9PLEO|nr:uncharacterized protein BDR25DRAFT_385093 [Lindgomyces ingoldianus]KAF2463069.1 hypothetical protein BDR25DRAFT_385093 [Lindgomyces ingoldianus]